MMNACTTDISSESSDMQVETELSDQSNGSDEEGIPTSQPTGLDDPDPEYSTPLHQPMPTAPPGRPCLKRTNSASPVRERGVGGDAQSTNHPFSTSNFLGRRSASEGNRSKQECSSDHSSNEGSTSRSEGKDHQDADNSSRFPFNCSFAAPRRFCSQRKTVQQVRFEISPQALGITHSSTSYDRTPIKCTKGSELDLSMPPRCSKQESEDEADDEAEGSGNERKAEEEESDRMRLDYFGRWANLKKGTIIGGIQGEDEEEDSTSCTSFRLPQNSSSIPPPISPSKPFADPCALPYRGVRSFGGLCSKQNIPDEVPSSDSWQSARSFTPPPTTFEALINDDATPMPSPSVRKSLAQPFAKGPESGRPDQLQSSATPSSYFDLARSEAELGDASEEADASGAEIIKEDQLLEHVSAEGEPIRMNLIRVSKAVDDERTNEERREEGTRPSTSTLLSACDLEWTLVSSTTFSNRNGSPYLNGSPTHSSRSSRSNSREERESLSAESCSEIEAVRQMLRRHALENRTRLSETNLDQTQTGITSPPLSPFSPEEPSLPNQTVPSVFSQGVSFPITPAADETAMSSFHSPTLKRLSMLSNSSETDSNHERNSSPISFLSSTLSTSNSISTFSSLASSPMSSRSSSLENWMNPVLLSNASRSLKEEILGEQTRQCEGHQRSLDPGMSSSCSTSVSGSLSDDTSGVDSPPLNHDSSSATSPELLPVDHSHLYQVDTKNGLRVYQDETYTQNPVKGLSALQPGIERDSEELTTGQSDATLSPTLDPLDEIRPPSLRADHKSKTKSSATSTKKKATGSKCKARKERERERDRERVRELLGEDGDCLGGF